MSYHDLSECTLSDDERQNEVRRILELFGMGVCDINLCSGKEKDFINSLINNNCNVTVKQLFWLRDIKDRLL